MENIICDTTRSEKIAQAFQERKQRLRSFRKSFSGTWKTNLDTLFPLLCPAREADWIPGWDAEILHSDDAKGYVAEKCVWRTEKDNAAGGGIWILVGLVPNEYVEFVQIDGDMILNGRVTTVDNGDGTVTGTWDAFCAALTEAGNKAVDAMEEQTKVESSVLPQCIEHYLTTGKRIDDGAQGERRVWP